MGMPRSFNKMQHPGSLDLTLISVMERGEERQGRTQGNDAQFFMSTLGTLGLAPKEAAKQN